MINAIKIWLKVKLIVLKDLLSGRYFSFARQNEIPKSLLIIYQTKQEIKQGKLVDNKTFNLKLASERINKYVIRPDELFSFWRAVGNPNTDYKESRAIVRGKLLPEKGGGLCQVSGILYYACLILGLDVVERHHHSIDIYTEQTRYAPLGTDATVVYGNKDFRFKNNLAFPISFQLRVEDNYLKLEVWGGKIIPIKELFFHQVQNINHTHIDIKDQYELLLSSSRYQKKDFSN